MNPLLLRLKDTVKWVLRVLPFAVTQNQRYDRQTEAVIRSVCRRNSNCIDVGTHRGEILDLMLRVAPEGEHFGFEPLPHFYGGLQEKYKGHDNVHVFPYALCAEEGVSSFNWVVSNPAYSGLRKRRYDRPVEEDTRIEVPTRRLDEVVLSYNAPVQLMKIDVEGGEMDVLRGAEGLLRRDHPVIIFEFGIGGSDIYGTTPQVLLDFLAPLGYRVSLMGRYLKKQPPFTPAELDAQFYGQKNFYFIAY
ncbi:FkbM family methyltransferase [Flaviaesturariibacter amylovorans]|uniref:Methyltransferase FkbM domain-containing protein n=1 Tax=Flaviaesturariibacter amylovorans TaxID=1084520 RepID=A0ABP8G7K9_9BACT